MILIFATTYMYIIKKNEDVRGIFIRKNDFYIFTIIYTIYLRYIYDIYLRFLYRKMYENNQLGDIFGIINSLVGGGNANAVSPSERFTTEKKNY